MEVFLEYLGDIILAIELLLLKIFGKNETAEDRKKRKALKAKIKAEKKALQLNQALEKIEKIEREV